MRFTISCEHCGQSWYPRSYAIVHESGALWVNIEAVRCPNCGRKVWEAKEEGVRDD